MVFYDLLYLSPFVIAVNYSFPSCNNVKGLFKVEASMKWALAKYLWAIP